MKPFLFFTGISIVLLVGLFLLQTTSRNDGKLHVIFCDVGQGDAVLIRTPKGSDMLFDGGPNKKVLSCLSNHLPFWDRDIELIFLSHPHADHLTGLLDVIQRYGLTHFASEDLANDTPEYRALFAHVKKSGVTTKKLFANDRFRTPDGVTITVLGPTKEYLEMTSRSGKISSSEFASLILLLQYKKFDLLLTGDSQSIEMAEAVELGGFGGSGKLVSSADLKPSSARLGRVDVLQVPHHGSRTGLTSEVVGRLKPKVSIISVGKNNYGHPSKEVIKLLRDRDSKILRTDRGGDIEIVSDGGTWELR